MIPATAARATCRTLTPTHPGINLPALPATPPPGGWTLATAAAAAWRYAEDSAMSTSAAWAAFRAICEDDDPRPTGDRHAGWTPRLRRAEMLARLDGRDLFG